MDVRLILAVLLLIPIFLVAHSAGGVDVTIDAWNADHPHSKSILPGGKVALSVYVTSDHIPVPNWHGYLCFVDPHGLESRIVMTTNSSEEGEGWYNETITLSAEATPGSWTISVCDAEQGGLPLGGGSDAFLLNLTRYQVLGIQWNRAFYAPGERALFHLVNDQSITNETFEDAQLYLIHDAGDISLGPVSKGYYDIPSDISPGVYEVEARGDTYTLNGILVISEVAVSPLVDVYYPGQTVRIYLNAGVEEVDLRLVDPSGTIEEMSGVDLAPDSSFTLDIPSSVEPGPYEVRMYSNDVLLSSIRLQVSICDLLASTDREMYGPGDRVKIYYALREIGRKISNADFDSLSYQAVIYTHSGRQVFRGSYNQRAASFSFKIPQDVVWGPEIWTGGKDNHVRLFLNVSDYTITRVLPLHIGKAHIRIDAKPQVDADDPLHITVYTEISDLISAWQLSVPGFGTLLSEVPPLRIATHPSGLGVFQIDRTFYLLSEVNLSVRKLTAPLGDTAVTLTITDSAGNTAFHANLTTDTNGKITFRTGPMDEGRYLIYASVTGLTSAHMWMTSYSTVPRLVFNADPILFAAETARIKVRLMRGSSVMERSVTYAAYLSGVMIASGITDDIIEIDLPESTGTLLLEASSYDAHLITGTCEIPVVRGPIYMHHTDGEVMSGERVEILYRFLNQSGDYALTLTVQGIGSENKESLKGPAGTFNISIPEWWTGGEITVTLTAWEDGHISTATLVLAFEGSIEIVLPESVLENTPLNITYEVTPPYGFGMEDLVEVTYLIRDSRGNVMASGDLDDRRISVRMPGGDFVVEVNAVFISERGLEIVEASVPLHVRERGREGGVSPYLILSGVLLIPIAGLCIAIAVLVTRTKYLRRNLKMEMDRVRKLKRRVKKLKDLIPEEEGIPIPEELAEEVEKEKEYLDEETEGAAEGEEVMEEAIEQTIRTPPVITPSRAPCPECNAPVFIPAKRPVVIKCSNCNYEFIVE